MANGTTDRALLSRFWSSASGFWKGRSAISAWLLTLSVLAMGVAQLFVQYRLNYWNRDFFDALERRDSAGLWQQAMIFAPLACLSVGLKVASVWGRMTTQRKWREWLTTDILSNWLSKERYRRLELAGGETKNAEYRISYDARTATDAPVDLALGLVTSVLTAVVFFNVLWSVGGDLTFGLAGIEMTLPGYLVVGVCIYSLLFTGMMLIIGRKLPETIQSQSQAEAEFLAAAHQISRPEHPSARGDRRNRKAEGRVSRRPAALAAIECAAYGNNAGHPGGPAVRLGRCLDSLRSKIPHRSDDSWRTHPGIGGLCYTAAGFQLARR